MGVGEREGGFDLGVEPFGRRWVSKRERSLTWGKRENCGCGPKPFILLQVTPKLLIFAVEVPNLLCNCSVGPKPLIFSVEVPLIVE